MAASRAAALALCLCAATLSAQVGNYVAGPHDVLMISVYNHAALTGKFTIEQDGTFTFPLIGRVKGGGLTLLQIEQLLRKELGSGFLRDPQVTVAVDQYRSQRVFVVGEVRTPGAYPMTGEMTLIEALALAGSITGDAGHEALILRPRGTGAADRPTLPGDGAAEVIRVEIDSLRSDRLAQIRLHPNDTIVVSRMERLYVLGQVRNPGVYRFEKGTTVLQAVALAGGVTERGSTRRIKITRVDAAGRRSEVPGKLEDLVRADDSIVVQERLF